MPMCDTQTGEALTDDHIGLSFPIRRWVRDGCRILIDSIRNGLGTHHEMNRAGQHVGLERGAVFGGFPIVLHR